jgi:hypothetical protein
MFDYRYLQSFSFRHALNTGMAVGLALITNHFCSFSHEPWLVLSSFVVCQTTRGTPIKQGMNIFVISALLVMIYSAQAGFELMQNRLFDVALGAFIGVACQVIIFPIKLELEFSKGVLPILNSMQAYSQALIEKIVDESSELYLEKRVEIENALQTQQGSYPEWVYEVGFNQGLRSGLRFFLINLERVSEIFFSLDYLVSRGAAPLVHDLQAEIKVVLQKNQELLSILIEYFNNKKFKKIDSDFTSDMANLEKVLQGMMPNDIEALTISPDFLVITAFVRDLRDLRKLLLQLVAALNISSLQGNSSEKK